MKKDTLDNTVTFTYDKNENTTRYLLDGNGNVIRQTDAMGHSSYFAYDTMNRLIKMTLYRSEDADGQETDEQMILYTYDKRGLLTTRINASRGGRSYAYDAAGNLTALTTPKTAFMTPRRVGG